MLSPIGVANIFSTPIGVSLAQHAYFCHHLRKIVPRSGGERAILVYVCKNGPVQEGINPSIYIINLTPLVYKNLTFYRSDLLCSLNLSVPKTES